jgi:serine/threonine protein kinase
MRFPPFVCSKVRFPLCIAVSRDMIDHPDGAVSDFASRFPNANATRRTISSKHALVLGKGQFGRVILVEEQDKDGQRRKFACKIVPKGYVFEANVLYSPVKPHILRGEVEMLRTLRGQSYCLQLVAVYETRRTILVVTELCDGGDLLTWAAHHRSQLVVSDVMRLARQLYEAVAHCDNYGILHRDIKPENVLLVHCGQTSDLRLIDFGSGCRDDLSIVDQLERRYEDRVLHRTMAGTAFYTAPEVFQHHYTALADVWSAAVTLYVLVASYPAADQLQKAFNLLQKSERDVRTLPGHEEDSMLSLQTNGSTGMPDAYFDFLTQALIYWPERRPTARTLLQHAFLLESSRSLPSPLPEKNDLDPFETTKTMQDPADTFITVQQSLDDNTSRPPEVAGSSTMEEHESYRHYEHHDQDRWAAWLDGMLPKNLRLASRVQPASVLTTMHCSSALDIWCPWSADATRTAPS